MRRCEPRVLMASGKGETSPLTVGFSIKQGLAAAGRFHFAVGQFGDLQFGGDGLGNAFQLARAVEGVDEVAKGIKCHTVTRLIEMRGGGNDAWGMRDA